MVGGVLGRLDSDPSLTGLAPRNTPEGNGNVSVLPQPLPRSPFVLEGGACGPALTFTCVTLRRPQT